MIILHSQHEPSKKFKKLVNGKGISIPERPNRENGTTFAEFPFVPGKGFIALQGW